MSDVLVLCYHAISPTWTAPLSVTPEQFEGQINYLLKRGWCPATFVDAALNPPARRTLAITFDDAYASVKEHAAPVLARLGVPATVFVATAFPSTNRAMHWPGINHWSDSAFASELTPMNWDDLRALAEIGWEIGSHTCTHPRLTQIDPREAEFELAESRDECTRRIGRACQSVAYPYGDVNERIADTARGVGYRAGAALQKSHKQLGPYRYPRVGIYHEDVSWRFYVKASKTIRALRSSGLILG